MFSPLTEYSLSDKYWSTGYKRYTFPDKTFESLENGPAMATVDSDNHTSPFLAQIA